MTLGRLPPARYAVKRGKSALEVAERGLARDHNAGMTAAVPCRLALVVIARDEAARIGRLLDSVRPWVDEMLVLYPPPTEHCFASWTWMLLSERT